MAIFVESCKFEEKKNKEHRHSFMMKEILFIFYFLVHYQT
jgi:hypothetical protein